MYLILNDELQGWAKWWAKTPMSYTATTPRRSWPAAAWSSALALSLCALVACGDVAPSEGTPEPWGELSGVFEVDAFRVPCPSDRTSTG